MLIFGMHKSSVRCTNSVTTQTLPEMPHTCSLGVTTFCSCLFTACALATASDWSQTNNFSALLAQLLLLCILRIDHASLSGLIIELCSPLIPFCSLWAITLSHLLTLVSFLLLHLLLPLQLRQIPEKLLLLSTYPSATALRIFPRATENVLKKTKKLPA